MTMGSSRKYAELVTKLATCSHNFQSLKHPFSSKNKKTQSDTYVLIGDPEIHWIITFSKAWQVKKTSVYNILVNLYIPTNIASVNLVMRCSRDFFTILTSALAY